MMISSYRLVLVGLTGLTLLSGCSVVPEPTAYVPPPAVAPSPVPHTAYLADKLAMERGVYTATRQESPRYSLYAYFLTDNESDLAKRKAAFGMYLCDFSTKAEIYGNGPSNKGIYLVPVHDNAYIYDQKGGHDPQNLIDSYDYELARGTLRYLVNNNFMKRADLKSTGLYFAAFDRPIMKNPTKAAIYEISGLATPKNIVDWLKAERQSIEFGNAPQTRGVEKVPSTPRMILEGLGAIVTQVVPVVAKVANAEPLTCE